MSSVARGPGTAVLAVIAVGGVMGSEARYALDLWWPTAASGWPLATWTVNVTGSFLLGALMVLVTEVTAPHRLLRPFLGVGVLGGYTTFSTATLEVSDLLRAGNPLLAGGYLVGTVLTALAAVALGAASARGIWRWRSRRTSP